MYGPDHRRSLGTLLTIPDWQTFSLCKINRIHGDSTIRTTQSSLQSSSQFACLDFAWPVCSFVAFVWILPSRRRPFLSPFFILPLHLPTFCVLVRFILLLLLRPRTTYFHTTTYYLPTPALLPTPIFTIHCPRTLPETSLHLFPQTRLNWVCPRFSSAFRLIFCLGASVARTHSSVFFPVAYPLDFFLSFFTSTSAELHQHHGHWLL